MKTMSQRCDRMNLVKADKEMYVEYQQRDTPAASRNAKAFQKEIVMTRIVYLMLAMTFFASISLPAHAACHPRMNSFGHAKYHCDEMPFRHVAPCGTISARHIAKRQEGSGKLAESCRIGLP